jgi:hypothetical protein
MSSGGENTDCEALRIALQACETGMITGENFQSVIGLLAECWDSLQGSEAESTYSNKFSRVEELTWAPPLLSFKLERHGGTVMGSSRASVHHWTVDVDKETADIEQVTQRQIRAADSRAVFSPVIIKVRELVMNHGSHDCIEWKSRDAALLHLEKIVTGNSKQTRANRRKRFRKELAEVLALDGWQVKLSGTRTIIERNTGPGVSSAL